MLIIAPVVFVLGLVCPSVLVAGTPFREKAYYNETDGLLYLAGMDYDIPATHVFNGSTISNRHAENELGLPTCPGSGTYIDSRCSSPQGGYVNCRSTRTGNTFTQRFTCAENEMCGTFVNANGQRRDQCVNRNFFVIQIAFACQEEQGCTQQGTRNAASNSALGAAAMLLSSDNTYVKPNKEKLEINENGIYDINDNPLARWIGSDSHTRKVDINWWITKGQKVNGWFTLYRV